MHRRAAARGDQVGRGRRAAARGASLVEFAIVLPMLVMLLFGIVDFGMQFANLNSVRLGTREGARQAVVATFGNGGCTTTGLSDTSTDAAKLICLTKGRIGLDQQKTRMQVRFTTTNEVGRTLLLCSMYPMSSTSGIFQPLFDGRVMRTKVEMRLEQIDEDLENTAETAISGQDWAWCA
jgi:Flp pilus assembly protein TadG